MGEPFFFLIFIVGLLTGLIAAGGAFLISGLSRKRAPVLRKETRHTLHHTGLRIDRHMPLVGILDTGTGYVIVGDRTKQFSHGVVLLFKSIAFPPNFCYNWGKGVLM